MSKLTATVRQSVNCNGFDVSVTRGGNIIYEGDYNYGYNCSYEPAHVTEKKPHVKDVLQRIIDKYDVDELFVNAGKNHFRNGPVDADDVEDFKKNIAPI